jgi:hypothetical protein
MASFFSMTYMLELEVFLWVIRLCSQYTIANKPYMYTYTYMYSIRIRIRIQY